MTSILLRDITQTDLPIIFEHQLDPEATAMAAVPSRDRETFDAHWAKILTMDAVIIKVIEVDGQVAGHRVSFLIGDERQVGYWLAKEFWGKGIASESLSQFLGVVKTRPLFGRVAKHNVASRRVLEKCGFKVIGDDKYMNRADKEVDEFVLKLASNER